VYPSYKTKKEQLRFLKEKLLQQFDIPVRSNGVDMKYYLPKGTKLYHGSLDFYLMFDPSCITCSPNRLTFFGLDITLALWYLYELNLRQHKGYGVIYEFEVVEDIPVHILDEIDEHPFDNKECSRKGVACIHPQYAYHGSTVNFGELSIELTMNLSDEVLRHSIRRSIHPIEDMPITYLVNLGRLEQMAEYGDLTIHNFNPIRPNASRLPASVQKKVKGDLKSSIEGLLRPVDSPPITKGGHRKTQRRRNHGRSKRRHRRA
jgi:hypothetical protein